MADSPNNPITVSSVLSLDVGTVRIGVAVARRDVQLAHPLATLANDTDTFEKITALVAEHDVNEIVVGWPRGLEGQSTQQTQLVEAFVTQVRQATQLPVSLQDEALTSQKAEAELKARKKPYQKGDIDALAAVYILDDFLESSAFSEKGVAGEVHV